MNRVECRKRQHVFLLIATSLERAKMTLIGMLNKILGLRFNDNKFIVGKEHTLLFFMEVILQMVITQEVGDCLDKDV